VPTNDDSHEPFTGPYYWIPLPHGDWELINFAQKSSGPEIGHVNIWPKVLQVLGKKWEKDPDKLVRRMGDYPYALPRGRVVNPGKRHWGIAHGEDTPPDMSLEIVLRRFNLPPDKTKLFFDEHEVMIAEHLSALERDLGITLNVKVPPEPDFDDF